MDLGEDDVVYIYNGDQAQDGVLAKYRGDGADSPRYVSTTGPVAFMSMEATSGEGGRFYFTYTKG